MKRVRRRRKKSESPISVMLSALEVGQPFDRPSNDLAYDQRLYELWRGHDHFGLGFESDDERRDAWKEVREPFMALYLENFPGQRPFAWWAYDAPEPRKLRGGHDFSDEALWHGLPEMFAGCSEYESQHAYLARLSLLKDGESERKAGDLPGDEATLYARAIVDGRIVAGRLVIAACQRHLDDLEQAHERGWFFNRRLADRRIRYNDWIRHYQGVWAGQIFRAEPWQCFNSGSVFGWVDSSLLRRFNVAYREVARKNGKSLDLGGDAWYGATSDHEAGGEIYVVANSREQADQPFQYMKEIRLQSGIFESLTEVTTDEIRYPTLRAKIRALTKTPKDGFNPLMGCIDELHEAETGDQWKSLRTGFGARQQALLNVITTSGLYPHNFGGRTSTKYKKQIDPKIKSKRLNDRTFIYIACLDAKTLDEARKELEDKRNYKKPNPNLGVSKYEAHLDSMLVEAEDDPEMLRDVFVKEFNFWWGQRKSWLDILRWNQCGAEDAVKWRQETEAKLRRKKCYGGLDLSSKLDLTAFVLYFPMEGQPPVVLVWFFIPENAVDKKVKRDKVPYDVWIRDGFVIPTPGDEVDYTFVQQTIEQLGEEFDIQEIAFDKWNAGMLAQNLASKGFTMVKAEQGPALTEPANELEAMVQSMRFCHGSNPVLQWCATNTAVKIDPKGRVTLIKQEEKGRIDGIVALVMAIWRAMLGSQGKKKSVFEDDGWIEGKGPPEDDDDRSRTFGGCSIYENGDWGKIYE